MAKFPKALEVLDSWEGGYSNTSSDPGGETYCGISRRHWPNWEGWEYIDSFKSHGPLPWNWRSRDNFINQMVHNFYMKNFWDKQSFELIQNQDIASKIFQHYVNMGDRAIKFAQHSLAVTSIREDGKLGQLTVDAINSAGDIELDTDEIEYSTNYFLNKYIGELVEYYKDLIQNHPQLKVFQTEWMLRAVIIGKRPT